ncbi:MAG: glycerol-3-phosphate acyltransferase [Anaerolineae bacterium]|nr:glycerol-3-phosphate acyltransferase [Anaerolineae bacterium]
MINILLAGLWGYLLGAIPTGVIVARVVSGVDVRRHGSGHTGGTNVARVAGRWAGLLTAVCDVLLGFFAVWSVSRVSDDLWAAAAAGVMVIVGHDWSVFIGFDGGIGLADLAGATLAFDWLRALGSGGTFIVLWLVLTKVLHFHRARATIFGMLVFALLLWLLGMPSPGLALGAVGAAIVIVKTLPDWNRVYE